MDLSLLPKLLVPVVTGLAVVCLRRLAPPPQRNSSYDKPQVPETLPTGVIGATMWTIGIGLALSFFAFRWANYQWAHFDGSAILRLYPPAVIWCFFPGFAALSIPWPLTVWLLRRAGRTDEADSITADSNEQSGMNSFRIMKWLTIGVVGPIAFFTSLAVPNHLSIADSEIRVGHYGSFKTERFPFDQATRAILVEGDRYRDGRFHPRRDLLIDFADGRRLDANTAGDGGTVVDDKVVELLLAKTHLHPVHVQTKEDIQ